LNEITPNSVTHFIEETTRFVHETYRYKFALNLKAQGFFHVHCTSYLLPKYMCEPKTKAYKLYQ